MLLRAENVGFGLTTRARRFGEWLIGEMSVGGNAGESGRGIPRSRAASMAVFHSVCKWENSQKKGAKKTELELPTTPTKRPVWSEAANTFWPICPQALPLDF